jgi:glutaredoxin
MRWFIFLSFFLVSLPASAEIYKWVDSEGVVHYSAHASENAKSEDVTSRVKSSGNFVSEPPPEPSTKSADNKDNKNDVSADSGSLTVFTSLGCKECREVKAFLNARGLAYKEYNITEDAEGKKRYQELGGKTVPFISVGDQKMNGFHKDQLEKMLKTAGLL